MAPYKGESCMNVLFWNTVYDAQERCHRFQPLLVESFAFGFMMVFD